MYKNLFVFFFWLLQYRINVGLFDYIHLSNKGNNKITELRAILQRESQNS
jgi:hypothetical protein